jgi:transglutaminase-like putative cysteine protease
MRLSVRHRTTYKYQSRARYLAQILRMTPLDGPGQKVLSWSVAADRKWRLPHYADGFGNVTHLHTLHDWHDEVSISVEGIVETWDTSGVLGMLSEPLPPRFFMRSTPLTTPHALVSALAARVAAEPDPLARLHQLMECVREDLAYVPGVTSAETSAGEALLAGSGVCQDHAHVFVTAARGLGHPARYVSGYLHAASDAEDALASHAWAEAWLPELGWVGFDPSNGIAPTERYVRTGVGLDYSDAAPVRGVRRGSPGHSLRVRVHVEEIAVQ